MLVNVKCNDCNNDHKEKRQTRAAVKMSMAKWVQPFIVICVSSKAKPHNIQYIFRASILHRSIASSIIRFQPNYVYFHSYFVFFFLLLWSERRNQCRNQRCTFSIVLSIFSHLRWSEFIFKRLTCSNMCWALNSIRQISTVQSIQNVFIERLWLYIVYLTMAILSDFYSTSETLDFICVHEHVHVFSMFGSIFGCSDVCLCVCRDNSYRRVHYLFTFRYFISICVTLSLRQTTCYLSFYFIFIYVYRYEPRMRQMSFTQNMSIYVIGACYEKCNTIFDHQYELVSLSKYMIALKWSLCSVYAQQNKT